jgi:1-aminocyclopropane-1-carboxylate deaminase/D-cysteine desulfhydrase-like pyridoxal-dependent ACC family enzyme
MMSKAGTGWSNATAEAVSTLAQHVSRLPRAGIHRWPVSVWSVPPEVHPSGTPLIIAEEHGGFAFGGNKVRQVDVLLARAKAAGADSVITSAGPQSNLCRVVAAGARAVGLEPYLVLRGGPASEPTGNQILYGLTDATITWVDTADPYDSRQHEAMEDLASALRAKGRRPYILDVRDDAGWVCALASTAIVDELESLLPSPPAQIMLAGGAGNTAAGILAALAVRQSSIRLSVVSVAAEASALRSRVVSRAAEALEHARLPIAGLDTVHLEVTDRFVGAGHGSPTPEGISAQRAVARSCGMFLDLTYTAKVMAATLASRQSGPILFLHTGGGPTVFTGKKPAKGQQTTSTLPA